MRKPEEGTIRNHGSSRDLPEETHMPKPSFRRSGSVKELRSLFDGQQGGATMTSPCKEPQRLVNGRSGQLPVSGSASSFLAQSRSTLLYKKDEDDNKNRAFPSSSSRHSKNNSPPAARSSTSNATFDYLMSPTTAPRNNSRGCSTSLTNSGGLLSPEVAALQKRLAEVREKLKNQEARHIQERLTWQGQTMELQRLRKERDRLLEDQTNQRAQLLGTESIAEAVMAENKCLHATYQAMMIHLDSDGVGNNASKTTTATTQIDWEAKLNELRQANSFKENKIGALEWQLEETSQHLRRETELNTEFVIHLNEVAGELRRQSSQKDLQVGVLAAQLDEKDQQLQMETDIHTQIVANIQANEQELRRQVSQKDLTIERLTAELNESRGPGTLCLDTDGVTTPNHQGLDTEWIVENLQKANDQLKNELEKTRSKDLKTMARLRKKLTEERSKLKRERKELQELKRSVVKESIQSVAVMSCLRDLVEELQQKVTDLQAENANLRSVSGACNDVPFTDNVELNECTES